MKILGLMSGTSMDGLDLCLADIEINDSNNLKFKIGEYGFYPYDHKTKLIIHDTIFYKKYPFEYIDNYLGKLFSQLSLDFLNNKDIDMIASHGQTISHKDKEYSIQAGNPKMMFEVFKKPIAYNFRANDIKYGGNGAPLVPILDWYLFVNKPFNTITVNIGGISNICLIVANCSKGFIKGFDTGPGMCLIDRYVRLIWNKDFDLDGDLSFKGEINKKLIDYLMDDAFIRKVPPKSASTEMYDHNYLDRIINKFPKINKYDMLRTLVNFTAISISRSIKKNIDEYIFKNVKLFISGGGVKNKVLYNDLTKQFCDIDVSMIKYNKINKDNKEAFLMCLLGYTAYNRIPNNVSKVTGASKEVVCGEIYE